MMINKRLINLVPESKSHIIKNVICQCLCLFANMAMIFAITNLLENLVYKRHSLALHHFVTIGIISIIAVIIRFICTKLAAGESYLASKSVKRKLRSMIYTKLLRLGNSYEEKIPSSEIVQVSVEGVDQLETYFGSYLPQFFYSMIAPLTLFITLSFVNFPAAVILLICVPLIPVTIALVQTFAKKLLSKYWGQYTALGDTFLENLQGLTTMKIYKTDDLKHKQMNEESEHFRKITMKVLTMQLNSITIMDLIAYGGAAVGIIIACIQFSRGNVTLGGGLAIILLAADFFIPMRMLGSYFHIAMNGMAASDKIFRLLDLQEPEVRSLDSTKADFKTSPIICNNVHFAYGSSADGQRNEVLKGITMSIDSNFTAIVGESGCGKSTLASILIGRNKGFSGSILIDSTPLENIPEYDLLKNITYIGYDSHLFKGTVKENLLMGNYNCSDSDLWNVLEQVKLSDFLKQENGLETSLTEGAGNLSGGQRQRLALARAILHNSPIYIFDEATSNVDVESENDIMTQIKELAKTKKVIMITHRLANAVTADNIFVMNNGLVAEYGTHQQLLKQAGIYSNLWKVQSDLENYTPALKKGGVK